MTDDVHDLALEAASKAADAAGELVSFARHRADLDVETIDNLLTAAKLAIEAEMEQGLPARPSRGLVYAAIYRHLAAAE